MFEQVGRYRILGVESVLRLRSGQALRQRAGHIGDVYRARDTRAGRTVTIAILPETLSADADRRRDLFRAANAAATLSHPNVAALYEIGDDHGRVFLAFEFVRGETLRSAIGGQPMNARRALDLGAQIAGALAEASRADIVHRATLDTIVVTPTGHAKLLYVGVAPWLSPATHDQAVADADSMADVRNVGTLLFEMLTGAPPNGAPLSSISAALPRQVDAIVAKALADRAVDRYASAAALAADLRRAVAAIDARRAAIERRQ